MIIKSFMNFQNLEFIYIEITFQELKNHVHQAPIHQTDSLLAVQVCINKKILSGIKLLFVPHLTLLSQSSMSACSNAYARPLFSIVFN